MDTLITTLRDYFLPFGFLGILLFTICVLLVMVVWSYFSDFFKHRNAIALETHKAKLAKELPPKEKIEVQLEVKADLVLKHTDRNEVWLVINIINTGEITAYVKKIAAILEIDTHKIVGTDVGFTPDVSELTPKNQTTIEIKPHGAEHTRNLVIHRSYRFLIHENNGVKYGKGYVELTTGEKFEFEFSLLSEQTWDSVTQPDFIGEFSGKVPHKCSRCGFIFLMLNPALIAVEGKKAYVTCPNRQCNHVDAL
jgi:hypothetical protein